MLLQPAKLNRMTPGERVHPDSSQQACEKSAPLRLQEWHVYGWLSKLGSLFGSLLQYGTYYLFRVPKKGP